MGSKLYLRDLSNALSGTFPTNGRDGTYGTPDWTASGSTTLKQMRGTKGSVQTSKAGNSLAQTSGQQGHMGTWVSDTLDVNQTVGGSGTITVSIAVAESNLNMNLGDSVGGGFYYANVYVWRPSTGAVVGYVSTGSQHFSGTEPSAASTEKVISGTLTTGTGIAALAGDTIIVEFWISEFQAMSTSYTATIYYDGTTENTTTNTTVSDQASYLQFSETLTFGTPASNPTVNKQDFFF